MAILAGLRTGGEGSSTHAPDALRVQHATAHESVVGPNGVVRGRQTACGPLGREPLQARRWVDLAEYRTLADWARQIRDLVDRRYP